MRERPHGSLFSQVDASSALHYGVEEETTDTMQLGRRMTPSLSVCFQGDPDYKVHLRSKRTRLL